MNLNARMRTEVDLNESEIDLNVCEHFLKANLDLNPPPFTCIDQREITAGVFLDLSKAFDTLDHEIMFAKLEHGVRGVVLQWIKT